MWAGMNLLDCLLSLNVHLGCTGRRESRYRRTRSTGASVVRDEIGCSSPRFPLAENATTERCKVGVGIGFGPHRQQAANYLAPLANLNFFALVQLCLDLGEAVA